VMMTSSGEWGALGRAARDNFFPPAFVPPLALLRVWPEDFRGAMNWIVASK